jgi:hypothetical protein
MILVERLARTTTHTRNPLSNCARVINAFEWMLTTNEVVELYNNGNGKQGCTFAP